MKTTEIILDLFEKIEANHSIAGDLPWNEIIDCVLSSIYLKKSIYPTVQYDIIENSISEYLEVAVKASHDNNIDILLDKLNAVLLILEGMPDIDFIVPFIEEANYNKAYLDHIKRHTVVFIGDSHVNFFSGNEKLTYNPIGHDINVCPNITGFKTTSLHLGACLAYNVNKISSSTDFFNKVNFLFANFIEKGATIVLTLGESDVRAHVKKQADLQGKAGEEIIDDIMVEYSRYILDCKKKGYRVCVWGPIASQPDSYPLNPTFPRSGTELERNQYALYFTDRLRDFCNKEDIIFLSIIDSMLTEDGHTKSEMLEDDQVHLNQSVLPLAIKELKSHGIDI